MSQDHGASAEPTGLAGPEGLEPHTCLHPAGSIPSADEAAVPRRPRIADIVTLASRLSGVPREAIIGAGRHRPVVRVRQAVYYVARASGYSYPQIGARMNKDHSSVIWGAGQAMEWAERYPEYDSFINRLTDEAFESSPFIPIPPPPASIIPEVMVAPEPAPHKPTPPPPPRKKPKRSLKPKNDFRADDDGDGSHKFEDRIARGSASLLAAIHQALAA